MYIIQPASPNDDSAILKITGEINSFSAVEKECVHELWVDFLEKGDRSDYQFCVCSEDLKILGFACYGKHALTESTFDLYWIAVDPDLQGKGVGSDLLRYVEQQVSSLNGSRLIIETSSTKPYQSARAFYKHNDYLQEAVIHDFYSPGDDVVFFTKTLHQKNNHQLTEPIQQEELTTPDVLVQRGVKKYY